MSVFSAPACWGARAPILCLAVAASAWLPVQATTTYTYTAPITSWYDGTGHNWALYAGLDGSGIRFEFTTAAPLLGLGSLSELPVNVTPQVLSWSYHGGSAFMNLGSAIGGTLAGVGLTTDATGQVLNHRFYLGGAVVIPGLEAYTSSISEASDGYDQQTLNSSYQRLTWCWVGCYYGDLGEGMSNNRGSGQWVVSTSAVPEPQSMLLMAVGGLALLGSARRGQHRAGAVTEADAR